MRMDYISGLKRAGYLALILAPLAACATGNLTIPDTEFYAKGKSAVQIEEVKRMCFDDLKGDYAPRYKELAKEQNNRFKVSAKYAGAGAFLIPLGVGQEFIRGLGGMAESLGDSDEMVSVKSELEQRVIKCAEKKDVFQVSG